MTWSKFLKALVAGGWDTTIDYDRGDFGQWQRTTTRSTVGCTSIEAEWIGAAPKLDKVSIDGEVTDVDALLSTLAGWDEAVLADV